MRIPSIPAPRRPLVGSLVPVPARTGGDLRRDDRRQERRHPVVVHVPIPLRASGAVSQVAEAYGQYAERRVVDLYL